MYCRLGTISYIVPRRFTPVGDTTKVLIGTGQHSTDLLTVLILTFCLFQHVS